MKMQINKIGLLLLVTVMLLGTTSSFAQKKKSTKKKTTSSTVAQSEAGGDSTVTGNAAVTEPAVDPNATPAIDPNAAPATDPNAAGATSGAVLATGAATASTLDSSNLKTEVQKLPWVQEITGKRVAMGY